MKSTPTQIKDQYGFIVENTPMDEMRVATSVRLVGATFAGSTVDTNFWATTLSNGTVTQAGSVMTVASTTTSGGSAIVKSVRTARYIGGSCNRYRAIIQLGDAGTTNNVRKWGMYDGTNGAYFKLSGTTLTACVVKAGVGNEFTVATLTSPTTNVASYEIYITNSKVYFTIGGALVATHNASTTSWSDTLNLPCYAESTSTGVTADCQVLIRVMTIVRFGEIETASIYKNLTSTALSGGSILKYGPGRLHTLVIGTTVNNQTISIYDATSATNLITTITTPTAAEPTNIEFHTGFYTGLYVIGSSGSFNITVIYE